MHGPFYTIFTPFAEDLTVDFDALDYYLRKLYEQGARRFYAMAYNSRYGLLSDDEIIELNDHCASTIKRMDPTNLVVVGDSILGSTSKSVEFASFAKESGADLVSILFQEKFFSDEQVLEHYSQVGNGSGMPIMVHEMPLTSGYDGSQMHWPTSLLDSLRKVTHVAAVKEDSKNFALTSRALQLEPDIRIVIAGSKKSFLPFYKLGARAYLNGISIIDAGIGEYFWRALEDQDDEKVSELIRSVEDPFFDLLVAKYGWHRVNKAILEAAGYMPRRERMPMVHLGDAEQSEVAEVFATMKQNWDSLRG